MNAAKAQGTTTGSHKYRSCFAEEKGRQEEDEKALVLGLEPVAASIKWIFTVFSKFTLSCFSLFSLSGGAILKMAYHSFC